MREICISEVCLKFSSWILRSIQSGSFLGDIVRMFIRIHRQPETKKQGIDASYNESSDTFEAEKTEAFHTVCSHATSRIVGIQKALPIAASPI